MKMIWLTQGQFTLVDDADYDWLNQWKWQAQKGAKTYYAVRSDCFENNVQLIYMHCEILGITGVETEGDHIDHNGLNNLGYNLRCATRSQNLANRRSGTGTSKYKGVGWHKATGKWHAYIGKDNLQYSLGIFESETAAALAYNKKAFELFGEYAYLNELKEDVSSILCLDRITKKKTSNYKGVSWCNRSQRWVSKIMHNTKNIFLGNYKNEIDAAMAYENKAKELYS